jgi:hypothetical protein
VTEKAIANNDEKTAINEHMKLKRCLKIWDFIATG